MLDEEKWNEWRVLKTQIKTDWCWNVPRSPVTALSLTSWLASGILSYGEIKVGQKGTWNSHCVMWLDLNTKGAHESQRGLEADKNVYRVLLCWGLLYASLTFSFSCFHEALRSSILSPHEQECWQQGGKASSVEILSGSRTWVSVPSLGTRELSTVFLQSGRLYLRTLAAGQVYLETCLLEIFFKQPSRSS